MRLLTVREACERLRISRAMLYKLVKQGKLSLLKVGGKSLVTEEALDALLQAGTAASEKHSWERYHAELLRLGLTTPECRDAVLTPRFEDVAPVEVAGKPASELIIEERDAR